MVQHPFYTGNTCMHKSPAAHIDLQTGQTDVPCPQPGCPATVVYRAGSHLVRCPGCRWEVGLSPAEADDLFPALLGWRDDPDPALFLAVLATRCAPVADAPPAVFSAGGPGVLKQRVAPLAGETPRQRAERLSEQYSLNGGRLRFADGRVYATSQQRRESDLAPLAEYTITRVAGRDFTCSCRHTGLCAHLAAYWQHLVDRLTDPERRAALSTTQYERTDLTRNHLELQFGINARALDPPMPTPWPEPPPPVEQAPSAALITELWGRAG